MTRDGGPRRRVVCLLVSVCVAAAAVLSSPVASPIASPEVRHGSSSSYLRIVVIGATGDLAAKYLWVACFRLALEWRKSRNQSVRFVAAARESIEEGTKWKTRLFTNEWAARVCGTIESSEVAACRAYYHDQFIPSITYSTLDKPEGYAALSSSLRKEAVEDEHNGVVEDGRLVYLAIPPQAFLQTSRSLDKYLRPDSPNTFFRVVIEKPFGRDLASAETLARGLRDVLKDEEVLLIDHYAGKLGVRVIDRFVHLNAAKLRPIWNGRHISEISIAMSERETCEHRIEYFDRNGIIRDVMSNHLQLILGTVVAPSLRHCDVHPTSLEPREEAPIVLCPNELTSFISSLQPSGDLIVGQYHGYNHDGNNGTARRSRTATAALTRIASTHHDWKDTRFFMSAAKATAQRRADVLVTFNLDAAVNHNGDPCSIRFTIQEGAFSTGERIVVRCPSLGDLAVPSAWEQASPGVFSPLSSGSGGTARRAWELGIPISAYDMLLRDAADGRVDNFMDIDEVLASWKLWSPIVLDAETRFLSRSIVTYPVGARTWTDFGGPESWETEGGLDDANEGICPVHDHTLGTMKSSP